MVARRGKLGSHDEPPHRTLQTLRATAEFARAHETIYARPVCFKLTGIRSSSRADTKNGGGAGERMGAAAGRMAVKSARAARQSF